MISGSLFQTALIEGDYRPKAVAYYYKQWNGFQMPFHRHDSTEIMFMISGMCRIEIEKASNKYVSETLKKGEFILLDANVMHRLLVDEQTPCRMLNVEFRFHSQSAMFPSIKQLAVENACLLDLLSSPSPYLVLNDPDDVYHVLKSLVLELDDGGQSDDGAMAQLLFAQLLLRVARLRHVSEQSVQRPVDIYVKQCIDFMRQNYDQEIQVKDIAAVVNLHPGYVHRIFKQQSGRTITDLLTEIRMEKAKMLLLQTDIPITDISDYVGVGSRQYFHLLFKKHTNQTPVEFRKSGIRQKRSTIQSEYF